MSLEDTYKSRQQHSHEEGLQAVYDQGVEDALKAAGKRAATLAGVDVEALQNELVELQTECVDLTTANAELRAEIEALKDGPAPVEQPGPNAEDNVSLGVGAKPEGGNAGGAA